MFWGSPLFDFALTVFLFVFLRHYLFLRGLNDEQKRFVLYSYTWIRILIVLSIAAEVCYVVGSDIALFDGKYYIHCLATCSITIYICGLWGIYIGHRYGPKTSEYKESLKTRVQAAIGLAIVALLMYFFR